MLQDESDSQTHLEPLTEAGPLASPDAQNQRKRMLIALSILLAALMVVVIKDWDFWFPPAAEVQDTYSPTRKAAASAPVITTPAPAAHEHKPVKPAEKTEAPLTARAERTALPPLQVEVVAGNRHTSLPAKSNAIHVDVGTEGSSAFAASKAPSAVVAAADKVQLSPQTSENVRVTVPPNYPMLARQMKVQGAVNLMALISREGTIQELQILSGPAILADAAREAVKQWRFKPYYQNGKPVETQARITVNFTISTN